MFFFGQCNRCNQCDKCNQCDRCDRCNKQNVCCCRVKPLPKPECKCMCNQRSSCRPMYGCGERSQNHCGYDDYGDNRCGDYYGDKY